MNHSISETIEFLRRVRDCALPPLEKQTRQPRRNSRVAHACVPELMREKNKEINQWRGSPQRALSLTLIWMHLIASLVIKKCFSQTVWFIVRWRARKWWIHCRVLHQLRRHLLNSMSEGNRCNLLQALSRAQLVLSLHAQWVIWKRARCFLKHPGHLHNKLSQTHNLTLFRVCKM